MNIYQFIRTQRDNYDTKEIRIVDGYNFSQKKTITRIELYSASLYENGNTDELGREIPFYNISTFRNDVQTRAEDLDTKDIQIISEVSEDYHRTFLLQKRNRIWMKEVNLGQTLNEMTRTRGKYGGVLVKKIEGDTVDIEVVPWRDVITDQTDIESGVIIQRHFFTPSQLREQEANGWENIEEAILTAQANKDDKQDGGGTRETLGDFVEVFEVHGDLPETYLDIDGDPNKYTKQMHIVVGVDNVASDKGGTDNGITLYSGIEKESPYKYLPYRKISGRALGEGIVEEGFQSQMWVNDSVQKEHNVMELAGKVTLQTSDKKAAKNIYSEMSNGEVLIHSEGKPFTQVNLAPSSLGKFGEIVERWDSQYERVSSTFNAITGETLPSGTPFRQAAILNQEAGSLFDLRREEMGIFIGEIYRDWIIPFLAKKLRRKQTLALDLTKDELDEIDEMHIGQAITKKIQEFAQEGKNVTAEQVNAEWERLQSQMRKTRNYRYMDVAEDAFDPKNLKTNIDIITTGEQRNKSVILETLSNVLLSVTNNPAVLQDPKLSKIFDKILETAGVSPLELATAEAVQPPQEALQGSPQQGVPQGGGNIPSFAPEPTQGLGV